MPLWVGGAAEAAIERTARWGTGWQAGIETAAEIAPVIAAIKQRAEALGRPIDIDHSMTSGRFTRALCHQV